MQYLPATFFDDEYPLCALFIDLKVNDDNGTIGWGGEAVVVKV